MDQGVWTPLPSRRVVSVRGSEAAHFLQNLVTNDLDAIAAGDGLGYGALLTPQGKIQFDFLVGCDGGGFLFDLPRAVAADFATRLGFYRLRAKVEIADLMDTMIVVAAWGAAVPPELRGVARPDPRHPEFGVRAMIAASQAPTVIAGWRRVDAAAYAAHRIGLGIPESGSDFAFAETFPHEADLDQLGGIDFGKGCYVGQEVVSRMEHRGTARRRIISVTAAEPLASGVVVEAAGQPLGTVGSVSGMAGLATIRLDRAREALDRGVTLTAGGVPVTLGIPAWARFQWPQAVAE